VSDRVTIVIDVRDGCVEAVRNVPRDIEIVVRDFDADEACGECWSFHENEDPANYGQICETCGCTVGPISDSDPETGVYAWTFALLGEPLTKEW
jgi:hypothetical protein